MTKHQMGGEPRLPASVLSGFLGAARTATGVVVLNIDFKPKRLERIYDADKVWSGEHTILDYTEI